MRALLLKTTQLSDLFWRILEGEHSTVNVTYLLGIAERYVTIA